MALVSIAQTAHILSLPVTLVEEEYPWGGLKKRALYYVTGPNIRLKMPSILLRPKAKVWLISPTDKHPNRLK